MNMTVQISISGDGFSVKRFMKNASGRCCVFTTTESGCVVTHGRSVKDPLNWARKFIKRNHRWISMAQVVVSSDEGLDARWDSILNGGKPELKLDLATCDVNDLAQLLTDLSDVKNAARDTEQIVFTRK